MSTEDTATETAKRVSIDNAAFVVAWQKSTSTKQIAEDFGITESSASGRASYLRKKGVPLKKRAGGFSRTPTDFDALAKLAKDNAPKPPKGSK